MGQFGDFLVKHHLPQACSTSISPSQKYGLERYTQTRDEHRFLDPSYTIAPKGAKIYIYMVNKNLQGIGI